MCWLTTTSRKRGSKAIHQIWRYQECIPVTELQLIAQELSFMSSPKVKLDSSSTLFSCCCRWRYHQCLSAFSEKKSYMPETNAFLHPRCGTCEYLELHDKDEGYCHRYPPSSIGESTHWKFPHVSIHYWCGEHVAVCVWIECHCCLFKPSPTVSFGLVMSLA